MVGLNFPGNNVLKPGRVEELQLIGAWKVEVKKDSVSCIEV